MTSQQSLIDLALMVFQHKVQCSRKTFGHARAKFDRKSTQKNEIDSFIKNLKDIFLTGKCISTLNDKFSDLSSTFVIKL